MIGDVCVCVCIYIGVHVCIIHVQLKLKGPNGSLFKDYCGEGLVVVLIEERESCRAKELINSPQMNK